MNINCKKQNMLTAYSHRVKAGVLQVIHFPNIRYTILHCTKIEFRAQITLT